MEDIGFYCNSFATASDHGLERAFTARGHSAGHSGAMRKHQTGNLKVPPYALPHLRSGAGAPSRNDRVGPCVRELIREAGGFDGRGGPTMPADRQSMEN